MNKSKSYIEEVISFLLLYLIINIFQIRILIYRNELSESCLLYFFIAFTAGMIYQFSYTRNDLLKDLANSVFEFFLKGSLYSLLIGMFLVSMGIVLSLIFGNYIPSILKILNDSSEYLFHKIIPVNITILIGMVLGTLISKAKK